jgi:DNA repair protein RecN (Recombination protein N)
MFCLGARADAKKIRDGSDCAVVSATFDISSNQFAQQYITDNGLVVDDDICVIRRMISTQGRSKSFINGHTVSISQLKAFGELLVSIHGQHAHQQLTNSAEQRKIIDEIGASSYLRQDVRLFQFA